MSIIRPWAIWRRLQYGTLYLLFWATVGALIFYVNFYQEPNCFDGKMNGDENGIDCGGACVLVCAVDVIPPKVVWVESFEIREGQYNVVAYIENQNIGLGVKSLPYTFKLLNGTKVVAERSGQTVLPPNSIYPVFEGSISVATQEEITSAEIELELPDYWQPSSVGREQFRSSDINLTDADSKPELEVEIENTELRAAENVEVVATIFNEKGDPVTASETYIERIEPRSSQTIVFTWPNPIAKTVKSCVIPTDVLLAIDLSGSMNNDGGNPPEPISSALRAASQFVSRLEEGDQVGVVTFATQANLLETMTTNHSSVSNRILSQSISPNEESGYTNTVAALALAQQELNSPRHNDDARRVLVLLTDGLPTAKDNEQIVDEAENLSKTLDQDGIEIYSIGLGQSVDTQFIRNIASDSDNAYFAPSGSELDRIYQEITSSLCEVGPTKIDVVAKTQTNFAPVQ